MERKEERYSHPSFGQIRFSRVNGHANFYGSELEQDHYISIEVYTSEVVRELSKDWYHPQDRLLILRMTSGQFSELITSLNHGSGSCCTIEFANGKRVEPLPMQESRKEFVHRKFEERMKQFANTIRQEQEDALKLIKKKNLSKSDIEQLSFMITQLTTEVANNIPFFAKCFQETMDEVVFEAKTEVENAIQHKILTLGLKALHNQNKLLGDGTQS